MAHNLIRPTKSESRGEILLTPSESHQPSELVDLLIFAEDVGRLRCMLGARSRHEVPMTRLISLWSRYGSVMEAHGAIHRGPRARAEVRLTAEREITIDKRVVLAPCAASRTGANPVSLIADLPECL